MNHDSRSVSILAVTSFVFGLLGWTLLPVVGAIVAVVTGHLARNTIRRDPDQLDGDGFAIAGLVLGYTLLGLSLLAIFLAVLFFGGLLAALAWAATLSGLSA
ncbi:MAG: DUF4190 domain-containing protein [Xanthomonadaceae bacterium]|jgi:hypothetical protein|nr:DUF4190 domain-containing protein [Xanthomonadaceae bacterium]